MKNGLDELEEKKTEDSAKPEFIILETTADRLERMINDLSQKYSLVTAELAEEKAKRRALEKELYHFTGKVKEETIKISPETIVSEFTGEKEERNTNLSLENKVSQLESKVEHTACVVRSLCSFTTDLKLGWLKMKKIERSIMEFTVTLRLNLENNEITEIENLENLTCLKLLNLRNNQIIEINGLEHLTSLLQLNLENNQITEIKGLENLNSLEELNLDNNQITEIKGLENLISLEGLHLNNNKITEIKGLETLTSLSRAELNYNQIEKLDSIAIKSLKNLISLNRFYTMNNKITEVISVDLPDNGTQITIYLEGNDVKNMEELKLLKSKRIKYSF